jgi:hypothetical protein
VQRGGETTVLVSVKRMYDYAGPFEVKLLLPKGSAGVEAEPVTIPEGASEARLVIRADSDASVGPRNNLAVQLTGRYRGKVATTQEAKLNVNVVR